MTVRLPGGRLVDFHLSTASWIHARPMFSVSGMATITVKRSASGCPLKRASMDAVRISNSRFPSRIVTPTVERATTTQSIHAVDWIAHLQHKNVQTCISRQDVTMLHSSKQVYTHGWKLCCVHLRCCSSSEFPLDLTHAGTVGKLPYPERS